jgi:hypothetical protein
VALSDGTQFVTCQSGSMIQRDAKTAFHLPNLFGGSPTDACFFPNLAGRRPRFGGWSVWITGDGTANPGGGVWLSGGFPAHAGWRVLLICRLPAMICRPVLLTGSRPTPAEIFGRTSSPTFRPPEIFRPPPAVSLRSRAVSFWLAALAFGAPASPAGHRRWSLVRRCGRADTGGGVAPTGDEPGNNQNKNTSYYVF